MEGIGKKLPDDKWKTGNAHGVSKPRNNKPPFFLEIRGRHKLVNPIS